MLKSNSMICSFTINKLSFNTICDYEYLNDIIVSNYIPRSLIKLLPFSYIVFIFYYLLIVSIIFFLFFDLYFTVIFIYYIIKFITNTWNRWRYINFIIYERSIFKEKSRFNYVFFKVIISWMFNTYNI